MIETEYDTIQRLEAEGLLKQEKVKALARKLQEALKWVTHRRDCEAESDADAKCDCGFEDFWEEIHK